MTDDSLRALQKQVQEFVDDRDWSRFHDSKNLSMAIASEAGELCAILRWTSSNSVEAMEADPVIRSRLSDEIGDVGILLLAMCNRLGLKLEDVVLAKLKKNACSYPVDLAKGISERPSVS